MHNLEELSSEKIGKFLKKVSSIPLAQLLDLIGKHSTITLPPKPEDDLWYAR